MDEALVSKNMPDTPNAAGAKLSAKRRWTDDNDLESDSDTDSDGISIKSTKSFEAQNIESVSENGRRYCNNTYFMPNDDAEQTRLAIAHQMCLSLSEGKLTSVPLAKQTARILDIGTGPGDWAMGMGFAYPNATIIATDIGVFDGGLGSAVERPNVSFQLDDARDEWTYHEPFDLIHLRGLAGAFSDWSSIYKQAFRHLAPGGYIEITDTDTAADSMSMFSSQGSNLNIYTSALRSAAEEAGHPLDLRHLVPAVLTAEGFGDVRVRERTIPVGTWPDNPHEKLLGKLAWVALLDGLEPYGLRLLTATGDWTAEGVRDLCEKVKMEFRAAERLSARVVTVTARKPFSRANLRKNEMLLKLQRFDDEMNMNVDSNSTSTSG